MGRLGNYSYPEYGLGNIVDRIRRAYNALRDGISTESLAQAINMSPKGGAFINVLAAMRLFSLVSGTGTLRATELGERLVHPILGAEDERRAREEAWLNVDLIRRMHERFRGRPPERMEIFYAVLREITGAERAELENKGRKVLNLYQEALPSLSLIEEAVEVPTAAEVVEKPEEVAPTLPLPADMMEFKYGGIYLRIPADIAGEVIPIVIGYIKSKKSEEEAR